MSTTHEEKRINKEDFVSFHGEKQAPNDDDRTELVTVENVFKEFRHKHMRQLVEEKKIVLIPGKTTLSREDKKKELMTQLSDECRKKGMKSFVNSLALEIVQDITSHIPDDIMISGKSFKEDKKTKKITIGGNVFKKRCYQTMADWGVQKYFKDCKTPVMIKLIEYLDYDIWERDNKKMIINQLQEIIEVECLTTFLSSGVNVKTLKEIGEHMYLTVQTNNVTYLVDSIIYGRSYLEDSVDEENQDTNIEIPDKIKSGLSKAQLHFFTVDILKKYLKEKGMVSSGRKSELVNMIITYSDDKELAIKKYGIDRTEKRRESLRQKREVRQSVVQKEENERKRKLEERKDKEKGANKKSDPKKKQEKKEDKKQTKNDDEMSNSSDHFDDISDSEKSDNKNKKKTINRKTSKSRLEDKEEEEDLSKKFKETTITKKSDAKSLKGSDKKSKNSSETKKKQTNKKKSDEGSGSSDFSDQSD